VNSYLWIHRIKGPAMLLVFGITALLNEWDIVSFGKSWPLYLITFGLLQLAERAAWSQMQQAQQAQYGAYPPEQYPPYGGPAATPPAPPASSSSLSITPRDVPNNDITNDGGR
jgi:hypothetical protein